MKEIVVTVLVASFGALIQELISWYNIRNTLSTEEHQKLMHDAGYWVITALMVVAAGIGTWAWFNGEKHPVREYLLTGAAFPLLLKKGAAAVAGAEQTKLGPEKRSLLRLVLSNKLSSRYPPGGGRRGRLGWSSAEGE